MVEVEVVSKICEVVVDVMGDVDEEVELVTDSVVVFRLVGARVIFVVVAPLVVVAGVADVADEALGSEILVVRSDLLVVVSLGMDPTNGNMVDNACVVVVCEVPCAETLTKGGRDLIETDFMVVVVPLWISTSIRSQISIET